MEELQSQELRIDEIFRQELRESQADISELTSPIQELQEGINLMDDTGMFQDVESACSGRISHVPSQQAVVPSTRGILSRDRSLPLCTWNLLGTPGNFFDNPHAPVDSASTPYRGMCHPWNPNATFGDPVQPSTERPVARSEEQNRDTYQRRDLQGDRQPGILSFQQE